MNENNSDDNDESRPPPRRRGSNKRRRFTVQEKLSYIQRVRTRVEMTGMSLRKACSEVNISHKCYIDWRKGMNGLSAAKNFKAKSICPGRPSVLKDVEQALLSFIFEMRERGMGVTTTMVVLKAAALSRVFREKARNAQYCVAVRFVKSHQLVHRMSTHESQKDPRETKADALDFMENVRPKLAQACRHPDYIINMDQTPVPFPYNSKKTLEVVGRRTINVRKSTNDTKRATFAMTMTASGKLLKPLLVFKGTPEGRIKQREFPTYPSEMVYACQEMLGWTKRSC